MIIEKIILREHEELNEDDLWIWHKAREEQFLPIVTIINLNHGDQLV